MNLFGKKNRTVAAALIATESFNHFFDFVIFPFVILWLGTVWGWITMTILSLFLNYYFILIYKRVGLDGVVKWIHDVKGGEAKGFWEVCMRFIFHLGHLPTFILLSWEDPSKAFFYMRGHKMKEKFSVVDWQVLILSNTIGTVIWTGMWGVGITAIKHMFQ